MSFLDEQAMAVAQEALTVAEGGGTPGPPGADGKSAYQIARDHGYGGTETQWLASLASTVPGPQGNPGPPGTTDYNQLTNKPALHAVATSGDYNALANKPTIPAAVNARFAVTPTGALTANTVKQVAVTWPTPMPSATYAISPCPVSTAPNTLNVSIVSQTAAGCVIAVRSTAAVGGGLNLHCIALG